MKLMVAVNALLVVIGLILAVVAQSTTTRMAGGALAILGIASITTAFRKRGGSWTNRRAVE